jgi:hypothetical protein
MTNLIEKEILYKNDDNHLTSYFSVRHGGFEAENEVKRERERERERRGEWERMDLFTVYHNFRKKLRDNRIFHKDPLIKSCSLYLRVYPVLFFLFISFGLRAGVT